MSQTPEPTPPERAADAAPADRPRLLAAAAWVTVFTVGWYLIHLATPAAMIAAGMSGGFWMIPIVFLLVAAAYYVGGRVLGRVIGRHAWLWAALAAVAPLVVELVAALVGGGSTADLPWARDPIWLSLQLLGPLAALLGARSFREASSAR